MKILAHIHTLNDEDVIERSFGALLAQTRPVDGVVIVDNGSTDRTLDRDFPEGVTVLRHSENLGTSGAVRTGLRFGMDQGYDWVWILDADCAPHPDALEKLEECWGLLPREIQDSTWRLSSLPLERPPQAVTTPFSVRLAALAADPAPKPRHGVVFTERGYQRVDPDPGQRYYACDSTIWSGCFFQLRAVRSVGLPPADYVLDWGEYEYGYRGKQHGFLAFMDQQSLLDHNIREQASFRFTPYRVGPVHFQLMEVPPIRCYYVIRNTLYFWLYEFRPRSLRALLPRLYKMLALFANFLVRPRSRRAELVACLRGFSDGLRRKMHARY